MPNRGKDSNKSRPDRNGPQKNIGPENNNTEPSNSVWHIRPVKKETIETGVRKHLDPVLTREQQEKVDPEITREWTTCVDPSKDDLASFLQASKSIEKFVQPYFDRQGNTFGVRINNRSVERFDFENNALHIIEGGRPSIFESGTVIHWQLAGYSPELGLIAVHYETRKRQQTKSSWITIHDDKDFGCLKILPGIRSIHFLGDNRIFLEAVTYAARAPGEKDERESEKSFKMLDAKTWQTVQNFELSSNSKWTLSPGKQFVFILDASKAENHATLTALETKNFRQKSISKYKGISTCLELQCSQDGQKLVCASDDQYGAWDLASGKLSFRFDFDRPYSDHNFQLTLIDNAKFLSVGGNNIFHTTTGKNLGSSGRRVQEIFGEVIRSGQELYSLTVPLLEPNPSGEKSTDPGAVRFELNLHYDGDPSSAPQLDRRWTEYVLKELITKKLGWQFTQDRSAPLLKTSVSERNKLETDSMAKSLRVRLAFHRNSSPTATWSQQLNGEGANVTDEFNQSILGRTLALVNAFESKKLNSVKIPMAVPNSPVEMVQLQF